MTHSFLRSAPLALALLLAGVGCGGSDTVFTPLQSNIAVGDEVIDLGEVIIGESADHVLSIHNAGQSDLDIESIEVIDGGSDYSLSGADMVVGPGLHTELTVTLIPTTIGDMSRDLLIVSDDPDEPELIVPIIAESIDIPEPDIEVSDTTLDFGAVPVGDQVFGLLDIANVGRADLQVDQLTLTGSGAFELSSSGGFTVGPEGDTDQLIITYLPNVPTGDTAILTITSNDPDEPAVSVELIGNGGGAANYPEADIVCPTVVYPPETITFDGSASSDPAGQALDFEWDLASAPAGFENDLYDPEGGVGSVPVGDSSNLFVDLAGEYEVQLRVRNEDEVLSAPAVCRFSAVPENAIHVELVWDEINADLDLHLAQEGYELFQSPGDVSFCNENPEWGSATETADNPYLELDTREGPGPESILLPSPADGDYYVRVHYYTDNGANDVNATVKIWIDGELFTTRSMNLDTNRVWDVGYIRWPAAVFVPLTDDPEIHQGARTCPPD